MVRFWWARPRDCIAWWAIGSAWWKGFLILMCCLSRSTTPGMYGWAPKAEVLTGSRATIRFTWTRRTAWWTTQFSPYSMTVRDFFGWLPRAESFAYSDHTW